MSANTPARHRLVFAIPGDIATKSGGYGYDRRVIDGLRRLGWSVEHLALPSGFPAPGAADLAETAAAFSALGEGSLVLVDGLAFGAMPEVAAAQARRLRLVALVHHPLAFETGLPAAVADGLKASETAALRCVRGIVVTSRATAKTLMDEFDVDPAMIHIAEPGTEPAEPAAGSGAIPMILSVGSLTKRKDHALLVAALGQVRDRPWQCRIVGSATMDARTAEALRRQIADSDLEDRIHLAGAVDDVTADYHRADIFALASRYEGYGMVFAEALAHGLPIVACRGGAIPDLVPDTAGRLVEPGDVDGFAGALALLLDDAVTRKTLAEGALVAGRQLAQWPAVLPGLSRYLEAIR